MKKGGIEKKQSGTHTSYSLLFLTVFFHDCA